MLKLIILIVSTQVLGQTYAAVITTTSPNAKLCAANETLYPCEPSGKTIISESISTCDPLMNVMIAKDCSKQTQICDCMSGYVRQSLTTYKCIKRTDCPISSKLIKPVVVNEISPKGCQVIKCTSTTRCLCPATCADPNPDPNTCKAGCHVGCEKGLLFDNGKCIQPSLCPICDNCK